MSKKLFTIIFISTTASLTAMETPGVTQQPTAQQSKIAQKNAIAEYGKTIHELEVNLGKFFKIQPTLALLDQLSAGDHSLWKQYRLSVLAESQAAVATARAGEQALYIAEANNTCSSHIHHFCDRVYMFEQKISYYKEAHEYHKAALLNQLLVKEYDKKRRK